jgi:hypothetical protein
MQSTIHDREVTLTRLADQLAAELKAMPKFKAGSQWHRDREQELGRIQAQLSADQPAVETSIEAVPANGQPISLAESIDHEAIAYRAQESDVAIFLADQLDRLAQLVRFTGATTPREHLDRMNVWDAEIAEQHFSRGYAEGREAGRREARRHLA